MAQPIAALDALFLDLGRPARPALHYPSRFLRLRRLLAPEELQQGGGQVVGCHVAHSPRRYDASRSAQGAEEGLARSDLAPVEAPLEAVPAEAVQTGQKPGPAKVRVAHLADEECGATWRIPRNIMDQTGHRCTVYIRTVCTKTARTTVVQFVQQITCTIQILRSVRTTKTVYTFVRRNVYTYRSQNRDGVYKTKTINIQYTIH